VNPPPSIPKNHQSFRSLVFPFTPDLPAADARRPPLSANDSHIRLRAQSAALPLATEIAYLDAQDVLDELCEDQLVLTMNLTCLEQLVAAAKPDVASRAALGSLSARIADLDALRDALAIVQLSAIDPRLQRIAVPESALADYLNGLYAWAHAVVRALDELARSLHTHPDWALLRASLEEAKNFHFDELHEAIRADLTTLTVVANGGAFGADHPPVEELAYAVEHLIATAVALEKHLDERFG
jgi:hypothetical protein